MGDIQQIVLTGVGAPYLSDGMYDIPTQRVGEFKAIGLGGLHMANLETALIVSIGTGTALVQANKNGEICHIGGSGVGGGTLQKLSARFAGVTQVTNISLLAQQGNLAAVDLRLSDISRENIGQLPPHTTVSNFGNLQDHAAPADIVCGLVNMIFESIGMMAVFACQGKPQPADIVVIGALSTLEQAARVFEMLSVLHPVQFHIPPDAIYATAVGAALSQL